MAETAIGAVLSKFGELAASEAKILLEVGDNMTLLRDRLEWLQAFIRDADRKRRAGTDNQLSRVWVRQTRDVAFQAEDTLDEFVYQVELKSQGYRCWEKMWRQYLTGICTQIASRHGLSDRIKSINMRLEKISENQKEYNIGHTPLAPVMSSTTTTSAWSHDVVDFKGDVMTLRQLLLDKVHTRQTFISVLGESGVGKATLISMLYNQMVDNTSTPRVFKVVIWYNMPPDSTVDVLLQQIYKRVVDWCKSEGNIAELPQPKKDDGRGNDDITDKLRKLLAEKRYLVIIGGISSKTMLNCVRASLPDDNNGSRVLLVLDIENEGVAWHANSMNQKGFYNGIYTLTCLDEKRSAQLFRSRALRRDESSKEEDTKNKKTNDDNNRCDKIVYDITGGYPLSIVVLAGLLRFKERPGQWEAVLQQLRPGPSRMAEALLVQGGGGGEGTSSHANSFERVFWASFEDLPNDLKSCFLYFVALPRNTSCFANSIVNMWIAEGFIKPQKGKTMEELGHNYLMELVLRCLVQIGETNNVGGVEKVYVHKRLHGLLQPEAREAGFMEVHDMHHVFVPPSVRRLSFMSLGGRYTPFTNKFPKLRSFLCWVEEEEEEEHQHHHQSQSNKIKKKKHWHDLKFLCASKFLRVISIGGIRIQKLPNRIGDMIHLRYLSVHCKNLKKLPSSIKRLPNLQTLDVRDTQVQKVDPGFWKIRTLRHVFADKLTLPETIEEELDELQTLSGVKPAAASPAQGGGQWKEHNCPLHKMPNLRSLNLHGIAHEKHGAALQTALAQMHLLADLSLQGDVIPSCVFTAPRLRFLQTVDLDGTVKWPGVEWDASKVRPNLLQVKLSNSNEVPKHIHETKIKILIKE